LGSNLGDRAANLRRALAEIASVAPVERVSSLYSTEPVGFTRQPLFYNLVVRIRWRGSARALLARTSSIERAIGRKPAFRNGPRAIDIDLLDVGGAVRAAADPILPHPRLTRRRFVLAPLAEIAPQWRDPVSGRSAEELLAKLPSRPRVWRLRRRLRRPERRARGASS
jgi:2-amino-4-hydroxy-6-hydroxymethyldihydropteridine diphosphokinase